MPMRKQTVVAPPAEWVSLMTSYDNELGRVRLLWRTGSSSYRPIVPITADFELLESGPHSAWEKLELPDTHFNWIQIEGATPPERAVWIEGVAGRMWSFSRRFARAMDKRCDFQLRGYDSGDVILFESGARHDPNQASGSAKGKDGAGSTRREAAPEAAPNPGGTPPSPPAWDHTLLADEHKRIDAAKDSLIDRLIKERNQTDDNYRKIAQESPSLISQASDILERAINYQAQAVEGLADQRTGEVEFRVKVFAEEQETQRQALRTEWWRYALDSFLGSVVPAGQQMFETWATQAAKTPFQAFEYAQQALAYLGMTLDESQLSALFQGKKAAVQSFVELLEYASGQTTEKEAIDALQGSERIFRSKRYKSIAAPEQQLAGRFVLSRAAMYRMGNFEP